MNGQRPKVNLVTVVWGEWHTNAFLNINVPTLLAPGNLPSLAAGCSATFDIYLEASEIEQVVATRTFRSLQGVLRVRLHEIPEALLAVRPVPDPIFVHRTMWTDAVERAKQDGALVLLMSPDVAWSNGSLQHVGKLLTQGRKVLFNFYLRVVSDTFAEDFLLHYPAIDGVITAPPRDLTALSMAHIHPVMAAYSRFWENYPDHAEMIIWPVSSEGLVVRNLARECLLFDPIEYPLNARNLVGNAPRPHEAEFIADSDDLFAVSLTPLGKELERWLMVPKKIDYSWLGRWWLEYDSPMNDLTATAKVRIHYAEPTPRLWQEVELESDLLIRRAAMYREALRIWRALNELDCTRARETLALAMHSGAISHLTAASGKLVIFAPSDQGFELIPEPERTAMLERSGARGLNGFIRAHVVVRNENEPDLEIRLEREQQLEVTALDGSRIVLRVVRELDEEASVIFVNENYKISRRLHSGLNTILRLEGILHPVTGSAPPSMLAERRRLTNADSG
jgi:hypothetical protein